MTDLRRLLHDAAATPTRPLDTDALLRSVAHRRRRWRTWLASLGAVIAIGTPVGIQWATGGNNQLRTLPGPRTTTTTTAVVPTTVTLPQVPSASPAPLAAGPKPKSRAVPTADAGPAPAKDCFVAMQGMAPGETKSCSFTATEAGGWWASFTSSSKAGMVGGANPTEPSALVSVTRNGFTYQYRNGANPGGPGMDMSWYGCGNNIIEPGDVVQVEATQGNGVNPNGYYEVGAGAGWDCNHQ